MFRFSLERNAAKLTRNSFVNKHWVVDRERQYGMIIFILLIETYLSALLTRPKE